MNHKYNVGDKLKAVFQLEVFEFEVITVIFEKSSPEGDFKLSYKLYNEDVADAIEKSDDSDFYAGYSLIFSEKSLEAMQSLELGNTSHEKLFNLFDGLE